MGKKKPPREAKSDSMIAISAQDSWKRYQASAHRSHHFSLSIGLGPRSPFVHRMIIIQRSQYDIEIRVLVFGYLAGPVSAYLALASFKESRAWAHTARRTPAKVEISISFCPEVWSQVPILFLVFRSRNLVCLNGLAKIGACFCLIDPDIRFYVWFFFSCKRSQIRKRWNLFCF